jgi:hypothetical protein
VYAWQNFVGFFAGALDGRSSVDIFVFGGTGIRCKGHFYKHPAPINFIIEPVAKMESGLVFMN